jgi:glycosyltransferase involved in cell wall biosynthesis
MDCDIQSNERALPRLSVGMPIFNGARFIRQAVDSILGQLFTDFELIISDNASTDDTSIICQEYAKRDKRIRYFRQEENKGAHFNFNFVLAQARGEYFMWAAYDDKWDSTCLLKYTSVLDDDKDVNLVFCNYRSYNHVTGSTSRYIVLPSMLDNKRNNLIIRFLSPTPSLIYGMFRRKSFLEVVGKFDAFDFFDVYYGHVVAATGKIYVVSDCLYQAGIKDRQRRLVSASGNQIKFFTFYVKNVRLIWEHFTLFNSILVLILFNGLFLSLVLETHRTLKNYKQE